MIQVEDSNQLLLLVKRKELASQSVFKVVLKLQTWPKKDSTKESRLLQLPNEILEDILHRTAKIERDDGCQFLGWQYPEYRYSDLKSVALACRRLFILCAPYLWRDKEFILPREDDEKSDSVPVQIATDILSQPALFLPRQLGSYVRSLSRDLTNAANYDLANSSLMARLVCNLRALRIDFHSKFRLEHYGIKFFAQHCPHLSELYLEHCRDTYDDFNSLLEYPRPLVSLTLLSCTIKQTTLQKIIELSKHSLDSLLLQRVRLEPELIDYHTQSPPAVTTIPTSVYLHLFSFLHLTRLALSDSLSHSVLEQIVQGSPRLEKLAIIIHETSPILVTRCIVLLVQLDRLVILSLAFRRIHPLSVVYERIACFAPANVWTYFASNLPNLHLIHISASKLLLHADFFASILDGSRCRIPHIMLHHIAWVSGTSQQLTSLPDDEALLNEYRRNVASAQDNIEAWQQEPIWQDACGSFLTWEQASAKGFRCFNESDRVCFVQGFESWTKH
ncbi:hypothetical protein PHYBLDRAFT_59580 [Phycomyces blakesleeanus NRRL 1555(-)]|uniref:Uncharacterized protein n=1 Tax=Phycomyces blakesleeanus (strain ATCC 8743b / DSM 1359 / FGSC 10004 / NBRC 33097 / NRRL 1555) TaxID=763407 RepID=A0A162Q0H7_PHYB8|nr:hypothetical protein PHYBLDRAFT_59580 [Phycomyces blakesleeanus NRRL 1555(-)]OAD76046.1 hypothetical protein PHYBLDRAFT_59580 [Phycomyces blakesleeanus NRRL 1555(-)]|eukprot:XP_018294086.1 hypothetical protein PHYBLDRAFT_59580 [Phycomyces blakesleeanus NRRL 1555(-)]